MNINVRGKNTEVTPALRDYVEKRVGKITRYFNNIGPGDPSVVLTVAKGKGDNVVMHIVEVTVPVNGMLFRAQESTNDMYSSIDLVSSKMEKQIEKYKTRIMKGARGKNAFKAEFTPIVGEPVVGEFEVARTKRFGIRPMGVDEAIMEMNLLNHDFFLFFNADEDVMSVVYRRKAGDYGLLVPRMR